MNQTYSNPCIRCGRERIVSKTSKERVGNSVIVTTLTVCPDPACQKEVERENRRMRDKKLAMKRKSEERAEQRKATRDAVRAAKNA
ncbi:hypothetical protein HYS00_01220 [Candidatus Microgenomates bacterium]|nr:hypothetical protein [Candidatus Microgenomates bacterium]